MESGDLIARGLAGLRELPVDVIATMSPNVDPGPQPPNVRIETHVAHAGLFPHCAAVVSHGGSGTVVDALAAGLPQVVLPMGADQPLNAARVEALGSGVVLDVLRATPATEIRAAVRTVLEEPSYRAAAERVREETRALPGADHAVALLERLSAGSGAGG